MTVRQFLARYGAWSWILGYDSIMAGAFFFFLGYTMVLQIIWATIGIALTSGKVSAFVEAQAEKVNALRRRLLYMTWITIMAVTTFAAMNFALAISEAQAAESLVSSSLTNAKNAALLATINSLMSREKTLTDQLAALAKEQDKTASDYKAPQERIAANIITATNSLNDVTQKLSEISKNTVSEINISSDKMFSQITGPHPDISRIIEVIFFMLISLGGELILALFAPRKLEILAKKSERQQRRKLPTLQHVERWVTVNWSSEDDNNEPIKRILDKPIWDQFMSSRNEKFSGRDYEQIKIAAERAGTIDNNAIITHHNKSGAIEKIAMELGI